MKDKIPIEALIEAGRTRSKPGNFNHYDITWSWRGMEFSINGMRAVKISKASIKRQTFSAWSRVLISNPLLGRE